MKKILFTIVMLFGVAYGQTIGYLRYDTVKIFTTKVGGRGSLDVTGNARFTGLLQKSAGTDSVIVRDVSGNFGTVAKSAVGTIDTWQQTLTAGSTLNTDNAITGAGTSFAWNNILDYSINSTGNSYINSSSGGLASFAQVASGLAQLVTTSSNTRGSYVNIGFDTVYILPSLGNLQIDTLNNRTTQDVLMGWTTTAGANRGMAGYITIGSGLSLASGNLTATGSAPSLTATQIGYGDGSNLLDGDATLTFAVGTGIVTAPKLIVNSTTDGGGANDAAILIQRTVNAPNGTHGFRDKTVITGTVTGTASFDADAELGSTGASVEMVGFQSRQIINKPSGTLGTSWSYLDNTQVISPITSLVGFEAHPYIYAGGSASNRFGIRILEYEGSASLVSNTYGIYWNALTKATGDNYGSYDNGSNKHYLYDIRAGNKIYVGGDVSATAKLEIAAGSATANTAPIELNSGPVETVIRGGLIEYNNAHYKSTAALNRYAEGGAIKDFITTVDNGTTVETDLYTYTTKASTLAADGEKVSFKISGTFNDITATAQLQFYYGGTNIGNTGALTVSATGGWNADVMVIRTGASTARSVVTVNTPGASTAVYTTQTDLTGLTFTNTQIIKITGTAAGASGGTGDISAKLATIFWHGAANN